MRKRIICSLAKGKQTGFSSSVAKNVGAGGSCCSLGWGIGGTLRTAFPSTNERVSSLPLEVTESQVFVFPARDLGHMTPLSMSVCFLCSPLSCPSAGDLVVGDGQGYNGTLGNRETSISRATTHIEYLKIFFFNQGKIHVR